MKPKDFKIKDGSKFMLIGKAEGERLVQDNQPKEKIKFMEDMSSDQQERMMNEKVHVKSLLK